MAELDDATRGNIIFVGSTLGPLFLRDPKIDQISLAPLLDAIAGLDVDAAAAEWPFVEGDVAKKNLTLMQQGLEDGFDNEELLWEYRRLFVGPAPKPAPPWGSVYTDKDMVVFGASTMELRNWLKHLGVEVLQGESDEPEDHIGTMLNLLAWLVEIHPEAVEDYLQNHLLTWSSHFLEQLEDAAEQPFYEGLAALTRASLEGMQKELDIEIEYPRYYR